MAQREKRGLPENGGRTELCGDEDGFGAAQAFDPTALCDDRYHECGVLAVFL